MHASCGAVEQQELRVGLLAVGDEDLVVLAEGAVGVEHDLPLLGEGQRVAHKVPGRGRKRTVVAVEVGAVEVEVMEAVEVEAVEVEAVEVEAVEAMEAVEAVVEVVEVVEAKRRTTESTASG